MAGSLTGRIAGLAGDIRPPALTTDAALLITQTLRAENVAGRMAAGDFGFMPVAEGDQLVGAVTDRDLVVRALATRELELRDYFKVFWKELKTGILLGVAFGVFMTVYVLVFRAEPRIAVALGITMVLIAICANLVGASLPFLFRRLGIDPALTSSPGITTVMDVVGLLIYFRVVIWVLGPMLTGG